MKKIEYLGIVDIVYYGIINYIKGRYLLYMLINWWLYKNMVYR